MLGVKMSLKTLEKNAKYYHEDEKTIQFVDKSLVWTVVFSKELNENTVKEVEKIKEKTEKLDCDCYSQIIWANLVKYLTSKTKYYECDSDVNLIKKILDFIKKLSGKYGDESISLILDDSGNLKACYETDTSKLEFRVGTIKNEKEAPHKQIKIKVSVNYFLDTLKILGEEKLTLLIPEEAYPLIGLNSYKAFALSPRIEV